VPSVEGFGRVWQLKRLGISYAVRHETFFYSLLTCVLCGL
jgi:hypothetical protein